MNHDILIAIIFIIFAIVMTFQSIELELGTLNRPGPGFLPIFSTFILGILSLIYLISQILKGRTKERLEIKLGPHWLRAFYIVGVSFFYVLILWDKLGYLIGTTSWLVIILWIGGIRSWKKNLMISIVVVIISYLMLEKVGHCFLPKGIFKF